MVAIESSRALVLIFTSHANASADVRREVQAALNLGVPVIPLRLEDIKPTNGLAYYLNAIQWLDAVTPPLEGHLSKIVNTVVQRVLGPVESAISARIRGELTPDEVRVLNWIFKTQTFHDTPDGIRYAQSRSTDEIRGALGYAQQDLVLMLSNFYRQGICKGTLLASGGESHKEFSLTPLGIEAIRAWSYPTPATD